VQNKKEDFPLFRICKKNQFRQVIKNLNKNKSLFKNKVKLRKNM